MRETAPMLLPIMVSVIVSRLLLLLATSEAMVVWPVALREMFTWTLPFFFFFFFPSSFCGTAHRLSPKNRATHCAAVVIMDRRKRSRFYAGAPT